jgi:hypothetical protein
MCSIKANLALCTKSIEGELRPELAYWTTSYCDRHNSVALLTDNTTKISSTAAPISGNGQTDQFELDWSAHANGKSALPMLGGWSP